VHASSRDAETALERLAQWAAALQYADIPKRARYMATRCIVDTVAVGLAGATQSVSRTLRETISKEAASGPATVFGSTESLQPAGAAFANAAAAHVLDYDDTCYDGILHASCVVLPAALACAEESDLSGADFFASYVAGAEVTYALGRALTDIFWKGWWTTATLGSIGAAAAASRALGLDAVRTAHALSLAATFAFGIRTLLGTEANPAGAGLASQLGVQAALFARNGIKGPLDALESSRGLAQVFNEGRFHGAVLNELGERYALVDSEISFKQFPACSGTQAATQAVVSIVEENEFRSTDIKKVVCHVTPLVATNLTYPSPRSLTEAQFSLPFAIGCVLRFGRFSVSQLSESVLGDAALRAEMAKVEMVRDDGLVAPEDFARFPEAAEVTVQAFDGRKITKLISAATGMPSAPMPEEVFERKFIDCTTQLLPEEHARRLLYELQTLDRRPSIRGLLPTVSA